MSVIAVIPARGGSKRIPRKNIKDFLGKPMIAYSIETALSTGLFDKVIVSTDDVEIASIAENYGADVPFVRPKDLADDLTGTDAVVRHAIEYCLQEGESVELACCIYATAPLLQVQFLEEGYRKLVNSDKCFAFSVTTFPFPIQRAVLINENGEVDAFWPEKIFDRSQDLSEAYHDAGQFYWGRTDAFMNNEIIFSPVSLPVILPRHHVLDIDTPEDWKQAELLYKAFHLDK